MLLPQSLGFCLHRSFSMTLRIYTAESELSPPVLAIAKAMYVYIYMSAVVFVLMVVDVFGKVSRKNKKRNIR